MMNKLELDFPNPFIVITLQQNSFRFKANIALAQYRLFLQLDENTEHKSFKIYLAILTLIYTHTR